MKTRSLAVLAVLIVGVAMAMPLGAQTLSLKANIPFEFSFAGKTMPAGEYLLQSNAGSSTLQVRSLDGGAGALSLGAHPISYTGPRTGDARITFNKYGNSYFLSNVLNGYSGVSFDVPVSRTERELARTASAQKFQVLGVLARL